MSQVARSPAKLASTAFAAVFLLVGATAASVFAAVSAGEAREPSVQAPSDLEVTNPRICAAEVVYRLARTDDWGLRAAIATATINGYRQAGRVNDCADGVSAALTTDFSPRRWQDALEAVDAVMAGDYIVSPAACARANAVVPVASIEARAGTTAGARGQRAQCVIYGLAFVEARR